MTFDLILVGFGNVARRFVRLLDEVASDLEREHDVTTRVVAIATRSHGQVSDPDGVNASALATALERGQNLGRPGETGRFLRRALTQNAAAGRQRRLVVVETTTLEIASGQPAITYIRDALKGGAHAITSNKGPAAFAFDELNAVAQRAGRCFLFESAVLDGVPLFKLKRATLPAVTVTGFQGVVNSTVNYILTAIEQGETFDGALAAMQRAGIAEADASLDVEGWDAAAKTAVVANALMGAHLTPHTVEREGVNAATEAQVQAARAVGRRLKLVASAERASGIVRGRVRLMELPETDLLAQLEGQQNAIILQTDVLGEIAIVQRGTGLTPTAYGLVSDLVAVARDVRQIPGGDRRPRSPRQARRGRSPSRLARRRSDRRRRTRLRPRCRP
jgi:homoserine dehydrogenase